tara:strand:- start:13006 stop:15843 length:2838 start_codon:yes stop_codon:yes gene_type:complete
MNDLTKKIYYLAFVMCFLIANNRLQAQENSSNPAEAKTRSVYAEKIYLQLNNTVFTTDKTIWFKAIVTNAFNLPTQLSGILYVELIDFDKNILNTKKLKLENGIADGFFQLSESYPSGRYLVRAYTAWDRNFGQDFIFEQYIDLFSLETINEEDIIGNITLTKTGADQYKLSATIVPQGIKDDYNKDLTVYIQSADVLDSIEVKRKNKEYILEYALPKDAVTVKLKVKLEDTKLKNNKVKQESTYSKTIAVNKDFLDVQFFPEGGKMIDGLTSKVAYKSINYKGLGAPISGDIVDETDSVIRSFTTNRLGMGFTFLKPSKNKSYYGRIVSDKGIIYKYPLPKVEALGYVLSTMEIKDYLNVKIASNIKNTDSLYFQVKSRGVLIQEHKFKIKNGMYEALVKKALLPNGIINITLFHQNGNPICERLFFNFNEVEALNIIAETDKNSYTQRDKTALHVLASNADGKLVEANLSALVIDKNQRGLSRKSQPNILSYFLLHSELKGFIEDANAYFEDDNMFRKRDLEALMLTQGWRNYVFNKTDTDYDFKIKPETDLWVSGKVGSIFNKNKIPNKDVDLTMLTFGKPQGIYTQKIDSLGRFAFNLNNQYVDKLNIVIQSTNKNGNAKEYHIELDKSLAPPKIIYEEKETITLADTILKPFLEKSKKQNEQQNAFKLSSNTIELNTVELTGYNLTPEREKMFKLHGAPDVVINTEDLEKEEEKWMYGLYSVLKFRFPDDINIVKGNESQYLRFNADDPIADENTAVFDLAQVYGTDFTYIFIDNQLVEGYNYPLLPNLPVDGIKSFEILKNPKGNLGHYYTEVFPYASFPPALLTYGIVSIYTYSGKGLFGITPAKGIFKGAISGFSTKREFYAPKYDNLQDEDWNLPDDRSTIYWSPSITTNTEGQTKIEFYNGDNVGDMLVVIEAITPDGEIGYYETTYTVQEKIEK